MKKTIFVIMIFLSCTSIFAMGFRDTYWGMSLSDLQKDKNIYYVENDNEDILGKEYQERTRIFDVVTEVSYFLKKDNLKAIGYSLPYNEKIVINLLEKLTEKYEMPTKGVTQGVWNAEQTKEIEEIHKNSKMSKTLLVYDDYTAYMSGGNSVIGEWLAEKKEIEKSSNKGFLYVFNDGNTDIYFMSDFVPDVITVLYTEHEDDF